MVWAIILQEDGLLECRSVGAVLSPTYLSSVLLRCATAKPGLGVPSPPSPEHHISWRATVCGGVALLQRPMGVNAEAGRQLDPMQQADLARTGVLHVVAKLVGDVLHPEG